MFFECFLDRGKKIADIWNYSVQKLPFVWQTFLESRVCRNLQGILSGSIDPRCGGNFEVEVSEVFRTGSTIDHCWWND
jgi:hypothetical protein